MTTRPTVPEHNHHAAQRIQRREENERQKRLREARRRDIDADLPLYTLTLPDPVSDQIDPMPPVMRTRE